MSNSLPCAVYGTLDPYAALVETEGTYGQSNIPFEQRLPLVMVAVDLTLHGLRKGDSIEGSRPQRVQRSYGNTLSRQNDSSVRSVSEAQAFDDIGCDNYSIPNFSSSRYRERRLMPSALAVRVLFPLQR